MATVASVFNVVGFAGSRPSNTDDERQVWLAVRVLNTCLYRGFRADLADREEGKIR